MLIGNVGQVGRELGAIDKLEGNYLAKSCKDPSEGGVRGVAFDLLGKSSNVEIVLGSLPRSCLTFLHCLELHRDRLLDGLVVTWSDLELHVTNCHSIKRASIFGMRVSPKCDLST